MKKALMVYGGWEGHEPVLIRDIVKTELENRDFQVEVSDTLDAFLDLDHLLGKDLLVPHWTMGQITKEQLKPVIQAVHDHGVGIAGVHGGIGDAFRNAVEWQFMVGGQWVAHPGGIIPYRVHIRDHADPITADLDHFDMESEQYYMHVDPSNHVLAETTFEFNGCTMPVAWKRRHGKGRVFYTSLGHVAKDLDVPQARAIFVRGMLWAAQSRQNVPSADGPRYDEFRAH